MTASIMPQSSSSHAPQKQSLLGPLPGRRGHHQLHGALELGLKTRYRQDESQSHTLSKGEQEAAQKGAMVLGETLYLMRVLLYRVNLVSAPDILGGLVVRRTSF